MAPSAILAKSVDWSPAEYEVPFKLTCYVLSEEFRLQDSPKVSAPGLPAGSPTYHEKFLADVKLQGSGIAMDGNYVRWSRELGRYVYDTCARTASGRCAVDGETVAVDINIVPFRSTINVETFGIRQAGDTGQKIRGHHLDIWFGTDRTECEIFGKANRSLVQVMSK